MPGFFRISARDHGALILMGDLASRHKLGSFVSLQDIADRMHLSQGYLEEIAGALKKAGLITGKQGPAGGYRLARTPSSISLEDILIAIEGPIELVECQGKANLCPVSGKCSSKNAWGALQTAIRTSLRKTTLAQTIQT
ncbi:Rrf2 family transcriptional regulator [Candidatus Uhrbacteria bacterium]|nr:Rrf2 family transcriptional regulator [Candidatus Uhrbacteria bacterium]